VLEQAGAVRASTHARAHGFTPPHTLATTPARAGLLPLAPLAGLADNHISAKAGDKGIAVFIRLWKRVDPKTHDKAHPRQPKA